VGLAPATVALHTEVIDALDALEGALSAPCQACGRPTLGHGALDCGRTHHPVTDRDTLRYDALRTPPGRTDALAAAAGVADRVRDHPELLATALAVARRPPAPRRGWAGPTCWTWPLLFSPSPTPERPDRGSVAPGGWAGRLHRPAVTAP
jgi:hypothetical protein